MSTLVNCYQTTGGTDIWPMWCNNYPTTASTITNITNATTTTTYIWITWVDQTGSTLPTGAVWSNWVDNVIVTPPVPAPPMQVSEDELHRRAEEQAARVAAQREREEKRKEADKKAMELLRENLTKKQRADLDKRNWFLVQGGKSKKTYKINSGSCAGNITELDEKGKEVARYCVHAEYHIPLGDQLFAQALSLRLDEDHIISKANRTALAA